MKFVSAADWHLSAHGPISRTDNWQEAIFAKLDQVALVARTVKARAILMPGDFFHQKSRVHHRSKVPFGLVCRLLQWCYALKRDHIMVVGIPGNHDEVHNRYESIPTQPLGLLFAAHAVIDCSFQVITFTDASVIIPPTLEEDPTPDAPGPHPGGHLFTVGVVGNPYPHATDRASFETLPDHGCDKGLLLAHCFASPEGGSCFGEVIHRYDELARLDFDGFIFGHDHSDHGVHTVGSQYFVNVGALSRGALVKEALQRDVKIAILDVTPTGLTVKQVKLKVAPAHEVFDLTLKAQKDRELEEIEAFAEKLAADLAEAGPVSFQERAERLDLPVEVRARVLAYILDAESGMTP